MNILNDVLLNTNVPINPISAEPLFIVISEKLYLHVDLLEKMTDFFSEIPATKICGEVLTPEWGKQSTLQPNYRQKILPSLQREYNMAIENAKWLSGLYMGEYRKNQAKYITMVSVKDKDCQILRDEKNPQEMIIKITHQAAVPKMSTYQTIPPEKMKYHLNKDGYRYCSECEKELVLNSDNFYSDKTKAQGFQHTCIKCIKKKRQQKYQADKAKIEK